MEKGKEEERDGEGDKEGRDGRKWRGNEIQQTTNSTHSRTILKTEVSLPS